MDPGREPFPEAGLPSPGPFGRVGGPLEPLPCGALEGSGGRGQGTVGGDLTFPCSSCQAGPEARVVVGVLPGCSGRLTSHGGQEAQSQRPPLKS